MWRVGRLVWFWLALWCALSGALANATSAGAASTTSAGSASGAAVDAGGGYHVKLLPHGQPPISIYAEEMGQGPPVLLLHGLGASGYAWRQVVPRLSQSHRVIALDLRGFGRSDKPFDQRYAPEDHAAVVKAFIHARGLSQVTLVGHSYGGMVALMLALDRSLEPRRIGRLVLISAPAFPQPFSTGVQFLRKPLLPYVALLVMPAELTTSIAFMMEQVGFDRLSERDISIYGGPLSESGGPHALIETARRIVPADFNRLIARYPAMVKPTLIVWCRHDSVVPLVTGERLAKALPRARLAVLDGCDHMPNEQAPAQLSNEIARFLRR